MGGPKAVSSTEIPVFKAPALEGSASKGAFLGDEISFDFNLIGEDGKPIAADADDFEVNIEGPEKLHGKVTPKGNGVYTVSFHPKVPGVYIIEVLLLGKTVLSTRSAITPKVAPVEFTGSAPKGGDAGEPVSYTIDIFGPGEEKIDADFFEVEVIGHDGSKTAGRIHKNPDGTYTIEFDAPHPGEYTVTVLLFGKSVLKTPLKTTVVAAPDPKKTEVSFPAHLYDTNTATAKIVAKDKDGNILKGGGANFEVSAKGPSGKEVHGKVVDHDDGTYSIEFDPEESGPHEVYVKRRGQLIHDTPFNVDILEGADAEYSAIERVAVVNCAVTVKAYTRKGVPKTTSGDVAVIKVTGPEGDVPCEIIDNKNGTYTVKYQAVPGDYHISATLNGKPVRGSPLKHHVEF
eukprot:TRINITY_DN1324_c0_g1_i1.p1 TRINITY_DN1324_c0_g1~~TRINITY_DN1324_c0_g1_i1.p1  ORF type:complete len:402 (-),score=132.44 TRINITY_DN1324_c0_g1_i1:39-1244(-)